MSAVVALTGRQRHAGVFVQGEGVFDHFARGNR